jgi:hypothetical protein
VQVLGTFGNLSLVVSGGGSAAGASKGNPKIAPAPASAEVLRKSRRLQPLRFWILDFGFSIIGSELKLIGAISLLINFSFPIRVSFPNPKSKIENPKFALSLTPHG